MVRTDRYTSVAIAFHWTIAALIIVNLLIGLFHESWFDGVRWAIPVHKSIGLLVLLLSVGRLAWRLGHRPPPLPAMPGWEKAVAHGVHWLLYALMVLMPLTGWAMVSGPAKRYPLTFFGLFDVPYLPVGEGAAGVADQAHAVFGYAMAALVVGHILAALRHHVVRGDTTLVRMWPGRLRR